MPSVIGATIAGYEITEHLGEGGMGAVFLGQKADEAPVAIKLLHIDEKDCQLGSSSRLLDEMRAASSIGHANVVPIIGAGRDDDFGLYIVYRFIGGGSLEGRLETLGKLSQEEVLERLVPSVLRGLHALHEKGVCHRDIKPANILYDNEGSYLIGDLGLAVFEGRQAKTKTGTFVGTPGYLPPERVNGIVRDGNPRGDLYSATVVFIEALTGKSPFKSELPIEIVKETVSRDIKPSELLKLGVPKTLTHLFSQGLARRPEERPADCMTYLEEITQARIAEEKTKTLIASSVKVNESSEFFEQINETNVTSGNRHGTAVTFRRFLVFATAVAIAFLCLYWRWSVPSILHDSKRGPKSRTGSPKSMNQLLAKWSAEIDGVSLLGDGKRAHRIRDVHRAFHRGFNKAKPSLALALKLENKILSCLCCVDLGPDPDFLDEVLLQSETFLNDLPPFSKFAPTWISCWHFHLLLRARYAKKGKLAAPTRAIKNALSVNPLPQELDEETRTLIERQHKELKLDPPKYIPKSERLKKLSEMGHNYKNDHVITANLSKRLNYTSIDHFIKRESTDEQLDRNRRLRYCRRIVAGFWQSYLVRTHGSLCKKLFWQHLKYNTWLLKARYSRVSFLLSEKDFQWGPGLNSPLVISSLMVFWRNIANDCSGKGPRERWPVLLEIFEETRNLLRNLRGSTLEKFRQGLTSEILTLLQEDDIFFHLFKARLILETPRAETNEELVDCCRLAVTHARAAHDIALRTMRQSKDMNDWEQGTWTIIRRATDLQFNVLNTTKRFGEMTECAKEIIEVLEGLDAKSGYSDYYARDLALAALLMEAAVLENSKKPLTKEILEKLNHAKDNEKEYDTGRRQAAMLVLSRQRLK